MTAGDIVTGAAQALSAPFTKLIEVCAAGCGRLYEPTGIRREAKAQGDALVIMAEARSRADEVSLRAAQRLLDVEVRRQENIEAIVEQAKLQLPNEVSPQPVAPDWAARFFREAQDTSDEQMRGLWARLLAGEVAKPGSFSARTLSVVRDLSPAEAGGFNQLCMRCIRVDGDWSPLFQHGERYESVGFSITGLKTLEEAGLISMDMRGFVLKRSSGSFEIKTRSGRRLQLAPRYPEFGETTARLSIGDVMLTVAGRELADLATGSEEVGYLDTVQIPTWLAIGWTVSDI